MKLLIILSIIFSGLFVYAEALPGPGAKSKVISKDNVKNIMKIKVYGMACPLCQSKAETKFKKLKEINSVNVDMEKMLITLNLNAGKNLSEQIIKPIVKSLGLTFVEIVK